MISPELVLYLVIFTTSQLYALYRFAEAGQANLGQLLLSHEYDFTVTCHTPWLPWTCNQPRDISDTEWQVAKGYFFSLKSLWFIGHTIGFAIIRRLSPKHLPHFITVYTTFSIHLLLGPGPLFLLVANIFISTILLSSLRHQLVHYLFFAITIAANNLYHADEANIEINLLTNSAISWLNARLLSLAIDSETIPTDLPTKLAYLLYFPGFFFGPIHHYADFSRALNRLQDSRNASNFPIHHLLRPLFWAFILEFVLTNCLYSSAFLNYPHLLQNLPIWSLAGFGFSLMLLFYIKYYILYSSTKSLAQVDGLSGVFSPPPQCIAHMSQTSYLWRHFDRGLYQFLFRYFYTPLTATRHAHPLRRILSSAVCFTIIALWHEQMSSGAILIWVLVNFILLNLEVTFAAIRKSSWFSRHIEANLSQLAIHRLGALLGSPYLAIAYLSNILFLSTIESTTVLVTRFFNINTPLTTVSLLAILYCGCHSCQLINQWLASTATATIGYKP